jgi:hypothetical protein
MGMADYCLHIERFDVETLRSLTDRLIANRAEHEREIEDVRARFADQLKAQEAVLVGLIESRR